MPEERLTQYLADIDDAAADWYPIDALLATFAPGFDEWNALRLAAGKAPGTFDDYLADIGGGQPSEIDRLGV